MMAKQGDIKPRYARGQKVIIKPVSEKGATQREENVNRYAGQVGEISNFYYINPRTEQIFFIYNVRVGKERKEIVVYEDELEPALS
jgi:ribosomal protein L21E